MTAKFYQTLNQTPRSMKHGQHRRAGAPAHRHSLDRASDSAGGADPCGTIPLSAITVSAWNPFTIIGTDFAYDIPEPEPKPKPPAVPRAGIRTGELIGHRLWWIVPDGLCSLAHWRIWKPGETVVGNVQDLVPGWEMYSEPIWCGVYAFLRREQVAAELSEMREWLDRPHKGYLAFSLHGREPMNEAIGLVGGTVKMWGDVIEHEHGYRAEFAKLHSIDEAFGDVDLDQLRARYCLAG